MIIIKKSFSLPSACTPLLFSKTLIVHPYRDLFDSGFHLPPLGE